MFCILTFKISWHQEDMMEFSVKSGHPEKQRTACLVVGVFEGRRLSNAAEQIDKASKGHLANILRKGDLDGNLGQSLLLHHVPGTLSDRVLLIGCGKEREIDDAKFRKIMTKAINLLKDKGAVDAVFYLNDINAKGSDAYRKIRLSIDAIHHAIYKFDQLKSKKKNQKRHLKRIIFNVVTRRELHSGEAAIAHGVSIAQGMILAKDLANLPGNICTPTYFEKQAKQLAEADSNLHVSVLNEKEMHRLGMNAFLAVSKGSEEEGKLITVSYNGAKKSDEKPYVFVGKGVTFDTGGICLKPSSAINGMKFDMGGAASVLAVLRVAAELKLPINVIGILACAENMPSGNATRPDDIVTSYSGQTIEIINTDAEGRLVLCDALTYCEQFNPKVVIDVATLTGACVIALGHTASGLFSNHNPLAHELINAGETSGDRAWHMPLWDEYQSALDSPYADMRNVGGREAGSITAACFLSRFTKKFHWAHLDVAGTAFVSSGHEPEATGRPVSLLCQYLLNQVTAK